MYPTVLLPIAKTLKQQKCPRTDEQPIPIAETCMKVVVIKTSDLSQKKKTNITYWWNLNIDAHEPTHKRETVSPNQNTKLWSPEGKGEGRY